MKGTVENPSFCGNWRRAGKPMWLRCPRTFTGWAWHSVCDRSPLPPAWPGTRACRPRLGAGSATAQSVEHHLNWTPDLKDQTWTRFRMKDTQKGPMVWEIKRVPLVPKMRMVCRQRPCI